LLEDGAKSRKPLSNPLILNSSAAADTAQISTNSVDSLALRIVTTCGPRKAQIAVTFTLPIITENKHAALKTVESMSKFVT
jgi:hypothetical protein